MQMFGQLLGLHRVLLHVVEPAAVYRPLLAAHALVERLGVLRLFQAVVQHHKVERGADPCDAGNDVGPTQQQVDPIQVVAFHSRPRSGRALIGSAALPTTAGAVSRDRSRTRPG
ncbi:hypothetical protein D3C87_1591870 [compost metagenome]